ncbi:MAG: MFS transporter, partial [Oscillospiraceae bacterium]
MEFFIAKNKWLVLLFGAVIQIFAGIPAAWGVFQKSVENEYALNQQATSLIFSFTIAAFGVGCILGGALQDKASPRIACIIGGILLAIGFVGSGFLPPKNALALYLVFSVNVGMGCAFLYPSVMSCVQKWYADKKGLATGVVGGAVGLSGIMLATVGRF